MLLFKSAVIPSDDQVGRKEGYMYVLAKPHHDSCEAQAGSTCTDKPENTTNAQNLHPTHDVEKQKCNGVGCVVLSPKTNKTINYRTPSECMCHSACERTEYDNS